MATYMNIIACNTANSNTGIPQCSFDFGTIEKVILVPKGTKFTYTEVQTLYTKLSALCGGTTYAYPFTAVSEAGRAYPIGKFINIEDKSTETTLTSTGYGTSILGKKGKFHFVWEYKNGGMNYDVMLSTYENAADSYDCLILDKTSNAVVGTTPDANASGYVLQGLSLDVIYCPIPKLSADGVTTHHFGLVFSDADELLKSMAYYVLPNSQKVNNIVGLRNFEMSLAPVSAAFTGGTTVLKLRITTDGGAVDLGPLYGTQIALLFAQFVVTNNSTGVALTACSAGAYSNSVITLTLGASSGTAGTEYTITGPSVAGLVAGSVPGFGNGSLIATTT